MRWKFSFLMKKEVFFCHRNMIYLFALVLVDAWCNRCYTVFNTPPNCLPSHWKLLSSLHAQLSVLQKITVVTSLLFPSSWGKNMIHEAITIESVVIWKSWNFPLSIYIEDWRVNYIFGYTLFTNYNHHIIGACWLRGKFSAHRPSLLRGDPLLTTFNAHTPYQP